MQIGGKELAAFSQKTGRHQTDDVKKAHVDKIQDGQQTDDVKQMSQHRNRMVFKTVVSKHLLSFERAKIVFDVVILIVFVFFA